MANTDTNKKSVNTTSTTIAERVALKAEELAWPYGTSVKKYCRLMGGGGTSAFKKAYKEKMGKYTKSSDRNVATGCCCCHSTRTIMISIFGSDFKKINMLPGSSKKDETLKKAMESHGFKRTKYPYDVKQLRRGDVCYYRSSGAGHVWIYLGNNRCAEASHTKGFALRVTKFHGSLNKKKDVYYLFRGEGSIPDVLTYSSTGASDGGDNINLSESIQTLFSSDNYKYIADTDKKESATVSGVKRFLGYEAPISTYRTESEAVSDVLMSNSLKEVTLNVGKGRELFNQRANASFESIPSLVESPVIILDFNGVKIGGFNNSGDIYPNYITSINISKTNGRINQYEIGLSYQVRADEDPNFIDKLISRTGYRNPLKITYGDCGNYTSPSNIYKEETAIITNVSQSENVSNYSIDYRITALSSSASVMGITDTFGSRVTKPSSAIYDLLYNSGQVSESLIKVFPGMKNKSVVSSKKLIPTSDNEVGLQYIENMNPLEYLNYLVSCMSNSTSMYYLEFCDDSNGAYFKIHEVSRSNMLNYDGLLYSIDVGYPSNNFVTDFKLCDNQYYSQVYEYNEKLGSWNYDIGSNGEIIKSQSNPLYSNNKYQRPNVISYNWWKQVTEYPISAQVTLKGLAKPSMLMSYVKVNAQFYGQKDIASGIYVVTQQDDSLSSNGYSTVLTMLRVAGDSI